MDLNYRIVKIDSSAAIEIKIISPDTNFMIEKDAEVMFKLSNDKVVSLHNSKTAMTCKGCGAISFVGSAAQGIDVFYPISKEF